MYKKFNNIFILSLVICLLASCKIIEKASSHGLTSGYYKLKAENKYGRTVYLDVSNDQINVYPDVKKQQSNHVLLKIPLAEKDSLMGKEMSFMKESLDIDITSILLKYRPSVYGSPQQLNTDLNLAIYAGWRRDAYHIMRKKDPLEKWRLNISNN